MQSITIGNKLEWVYTPGNHLRLQDNSGRKELQEFPIQPPGERRVISEVLSGSFAVLSSLLLEISTDKLHNLPVQPVPLLDYSLASEKFSLAEHFCT